MFHTFHATKPPNESNTGKGLRPPAARRITTTNACASCRRRKIRCDGSAPCGQCIYYQQADVCVYHKPTARLVPSKKLVEDLSASLDQYRTVFERLLPGCDIERAISLSKEGLIAIIQEKPVKTSDGQSHVLESPVSTLESEGADSLETLIQAPEQDPRLDEATRHHARVQGISDDVNGLSLSLDRPSSYVGVSSITAALKVIFRVAPATQRLLALGQTETAIHSRACSPEPDSTSPDPTCLPPAEIGQVLIEAYFQKVHPLMPMLDESQFWQTWLYGERKDSAWLALLNTVLALGSVVSSDCTNESHRVYFQRVMQLLDFDSLGSGNTLVVQALGLLSGYYLHYVNRPNLANNLMGATLRQATVLGLHREFSDSTPVDQNTGTKATSADVRRRTWWSLYVLDTWANTTTGRPSLSSLSRGITVNIPSILNVQDQATVKVLPLVYNVTFCKIATQIQDALSATPLLPFDELNQLDQELLQWYNGLPSQLRPSIVSESRASSKKPQQTDHSNRQTQDILRTPRMIMHWRYQNLRLLLYRPYLLATALRVIPDSPLSAEEKVCVGRCRAIAARTIADINAMSGEELLSGWNGVWFMFQASMVPLVGIFSNLSTATRQCTQGANSRNLSDTGRENQNDQGNTELKEWQGQIEHAIVFFERMNRWSVAAKKSKDVVSRLYEASKQLAEHTASRSDVAAHNAEARTSSWNIQAGSDGQTGLATGQQTSLEGQTHDASLPLPTTNTITEDICGLSPNGAAAMSNFWYDDMMWDLPVADAVLGNTGTGFEYSELDWLSTQRAGDQAWYLGQ